VPEVEGQTEEVRLVAGDPLGKARVAQGVGGLGWEDVHVQGVAERVRLRCRRIEASGKDPG
jgi:hypothetical protein